jgi:hypothetical protein
MTVTGIAMGRRSMKEHEQTAVRATQNGRMGTVPVLGSVDGHLMGDSPAHPIAFRELMSGFRILLFPIPPI